MDFASIMAGIPASRREELNLSMFKAYDIRTKSSRLTPVLAERLVSAVGLYMTEALKVSKVVIGRDARLSAPALAETALDVLPGLGLEVVVNPLQSSTCQFYFACMRNPDAAAIMFTASHNPGEYIGLKILGPGMRSIAMDSGPEGGLAGVLARYAAGAKARAEGARSRVSVRRYLDEYVDYSLRLAGVGPGSLSGARILLDFLCGAAGTEIAEALGEAGAGFDVMNLVPDGRFPAGDPNPLVAGSAHPAKERLARGGYLCGFLYDGDGDRMDVMDSRGEQLAPSFNVSALLPDILDAFMNAGGPGRTGGARPEWRPQIYSDVKANPLAMREQAARGVGVHIIRNGHSFIKEALRANFPGQYLLASEESAHYYMNFPLVPGDWSRGFAATENTLYFTLLTAKAWAKDPGRHERAMAAQKTLAREREWACHFDDERLSEKVLKEVEAEFEARGVTVIRTMEDGSGLDATLMRRGLPEIVRADTDLSGPWCQVAQRISRSEEGMARWEVVSNSTQACRDAVAAVRRVTDRYVDSGLAAYE